MSDRVFVLPEPRAIELSVSAAKKLIDAKSGDAALLYIYILQNGGNLSAVEAAEKLGRTEESIDEAFAILGRLGLVSYTGLRRKERPETPVSRDEAPEYSISDIKKKMESGSKFGQLVSAVQKSLGKVLSGAELTTLFGLYDYLGLPEEVILLLVNYCVEDFKEKYGQGRMPTMRSIEKQAFIWARLEIMTLELAEDHIKKQARRKSETEAVRRALRIYDRALSPTESKYISAWLQIGFDAEVIELAYDRTVVKTGKLSWAYMNSILSNWELKGLKTVKEVEQLDGVRQKPGAETKIPEAPDASEAERLKKYLKKFEDK
jgi:DnaD/phage-associated family protein